MNLPEIEDFIRQNSFAILTSQVDGKPWATHIPVELEKNEIGEKVLWCYVAKVHPQWKSLEANPDVLAIFSGPPSLHLFFLVQSHQCTHLEFYCCACIWQNQHHE